jgi:hypothetical protein
MELEFSVKDQQHRLSVVAHEGRTELVFDDNAMPIMGSLQDIVKYHQEHNIVATLLYADEETKAFLETLAKVFQHLGCKTELRVLWQLGEYNLEEMYNGYVVATYGAPNRTDITNLTQLHAQIMWAANLLIDNDTGSLIEFYRAGFHYGSTHELVRGIKDMATAISYKLFGEQSS